MRRMPRGLLVLVSLVAALALVAGVSLLRTGTIAPSPAVNGPGTAATDTRGADADEADAPDAQQGEADDNENDEAAEQADGIARRREALESAIAAGAGVGQQRPLGDAPAAGWAGEQPFEATAPDDWEPAVAADPHAPWVYVVVTRYGVTKPCNGNCPTPYIALRVSSDGGATFGPSSALCACKGSGQFDPIIEVVPNTGAVYALYMNGFNVLFTKSTNHGATWSAPVKT